jgi:hypothetical protein
VHRVVADEGRTAGAAEDKQPSAAPAQEEK